MTAAAHALGLPVPIRRPRVDTVDVCPKPITRQDRARRVMFRVAASFLGLVIVATGQQVAARGWRAFVFRAPGVGGTPVRADVAAPTAASDLGSGVVSTTIAVTLPPTLRARRHHRTVSAVPIALPPSRGIVSVRGHTHRRAPADGQLSVVYVPAPAVPPTTTPVDPPTPPPGDPPTSAPIVAPPVPGEGAVGVDPMGPAPSRPPPRRPRPPGRPPRPEPPDSSDV